MARKSPFFVPPPAPPPAPKGPSPLTGVKTVAITIGALLGVSAAALVVVPPLLSRSRQQVEEPTKPKAVEKNEHDEKDPAPKLASVLPILETDPVRGGARALVTIVEFADFQCPFCQRAQSTLDGLLAKYGDDLRVVWKDQPLPFHKDAHPAAKLGRVAFLEGGPKAFWKLHDRIWRDQKLLSTELETWAGGVGADATAVARHGKEADALVDASIDLANEVGARGTPTFFVDGERLSGAQPASAFEKVIDAHLEEAKKLVASGVERQDLYATMVDRHYEDVGAPGTLYKVDVTGAPSWGAADALVTIVVFGDLASGPKKGVHDWLLDDLVALPDTRVVFRDRPSATDGRKAAAVVRAIGAKGGEHERRKAIDALWSGGALPTDLVTFGTDHGLTTAEASKAIATAATDKGIDDDLDRAAEVDATATAVYVNGHRLWSYTKKEILSAHAAEKRRAQRVVAKGVAPKDLYAELVKSGTTRAPKHVAVPVPPWAPTKGPPSAKVTIQVFSDFQCPFCKRASLPGGGFADAVAAHASDVKVVFRHNPLAFHPMAEPAAQLALEAKAQKGVAAFWRVHDALFAVGSTTLTTAKLEAIAVAEGLDLPKVRAAIATHAHKKVIDDDVAEAKRAGISGTPAFVVGSELVSGAQPKAAFEAAIKRALAAP